MNNGIDTSNPEIYAKIGKMDIESNLKTLLLINLKKATI